MVSPKVNEKWHPHRPEMMEVVVTVDHQSIHEPCEDALLEFSSAERD